MWKLYRSGIGKSLLRRINEVAIPFKGESAGK